MFKDGHLYKHKNSELYMEVSNVKMSSASRTYLRVMWFNRRGVFMGLDDVTVKHSDLHNWSEINDTFLSDGGTASNNNSSGDMK